MSHSGEICIRCQGAGEAFYLHELGRPGEFRSELSTCTWCKGSGFEPNPSFMSLKVSGQRAQKALNAAIKAIDKRVK